MNVNTTTTDDEDDDQYYHSRNDGYLSSDLSTQSEGDDDDDDDDYDDDHVGGGIKGGLDNNGGYEGLLGDYGRHYDSEDSRDFVGSQHPLDDDDDNSDNEKELEGLTDGQYSTTDNHRESYLSRVDSRRRDSDSKYNSQDDYEDDSYYHQEEQSHRQSLVSNDNSRPDDDLLYGSGRRYRDTNSLEYSRQEEEEDDDEYYSHKDDRSSSSWQRRRRRRDSRRDNDDDDDSSRGNSSRDSPYSQTSHQSGLQQKLRQQAYNNNGSSSNHSVASQSVASRSAVREQDDDRSMATKDNDSGLAAESSRNQYDGLDAPLSEAQPHHNDMEQQDSVLSMDEDRIGTESLSHNRDGSVVSKDPSQRISVHDNDHGNDKERLDQTENESMTASTQTPSPSNKDDDHHHVMNNDNIHQSSLSSSLTDRDQQDSMPINGDSTSPDDGTTTSNNQDTLEISNTPKEIPTPQQDPIVLDISGAPDPVPYRGFPCHNGTPFVIYDPPAKTQDEPQDLDEMYPYREGHIFFDKVLVREYNLTVGDSPSCTDSLPIMLDWDHGQLRVWNINDYEKVKDMFPIPDDAEGMARRLSFEERRQLLIDVADYNDRKIRYEERSYLRQRQADQRAAQEGPPQGGGGGAGGSGLQNPGGFAWTKLFFSSPSTTTTSTTEEEEESE